ncbi:MAG: squalene--hopene cyclase [Acidobacteria bacterium]|nr:squalene--hopene cyclase [Acidobacteriota bacterium]
MSDVAAAGALDWTIETLAARLLDRRTPAGHWEGYLAGSALATATSVVALTLDGRQSGRDHRALVAAGRAWLVANQNDDGGWGDTTISLSNLSTTVLCWAALTDVRRARHWHPTAQACAVGTPPEAAPGRAVKARPTATVLEADVEGLPTALDRAERWLRTQIGDVTAASLRRAILARYGRDRTFSVPILAVLALTGTLGAGWRAWRLVPQLPFELAACPHRWFRWLRLPVVSYALPALVALGQLRHHHAPTRTLPLRWLRSALRPRTLAVARAMQPASGGFLEAVPLTAFVVMSLVSAGSAKDPLIARGIRFLNDSVRRDGSWPIDTNLATWVTTQSVKALGGQWLTPTDRHGLLRWLLDQQVAEEHPFTHAQPGGWAWTDRSGGVPDADDTAGAVIAIRMLAGPQAWSPPRTPARRGADGPPGGTVTEAATAGITWLLDLQNQDGGIPTFCRGWGGLPFDRSAPDLTAHALEAWNVWLDGVVLEVQRRVVTAAERAVAYLARRQRPDGSWLPLWFGNQHVAGELNPTYGTARVVSALTTPLARRSAQSAGSLERGVAWLLRAQNEDGGWGGGGSPSSIEETGLALDALCRRLGDHEGRPCGGSAPGLAVAVRRGADWLVRATDQGRRTPPSPIGLYFARLWYSEELYPLVWSLKGLTQARAHLTLTP